jgi:hypothetical protein
MQQEISQLIGGNLTVDDEDAILAELAEIEREEALALEAALPEAPTTAIEQGVWDPSVVFCAWCGLIEYLLSALVLL